MIRPGLHELYAGRRMEETTLQENQEVEYKNPDEDQGGIRRRLRDRDLLRKRKAEAEAKETNQWVLGEESQRKRPRAENKSGAKRRGRPRKTEPTPEIFFSLGETPTPQEAPVVLPEPAEVIPDQISGSLESQPASVLIAPAPLPLFGSIQNNVSAPTLTSPALVSTTIPIPSPTKVLDTSSTPVQDSAPAPAPAPDDVPDPILDPVPDPVSIPGLVPGTATAETPAPTAAFDLLSAPVLDETLYTETQGKVAPNQVMIEDLGPDEEEDITPSQENRKEEGLSVMPSLSTPEQSKIFSVPTLSSQPPPPEYLPGNSV
ncbi:anti-sigma-I factor RsgI2 isoform X1 [Xyrichtys novacula]|uniref:Anti-sigma-I factor RsgI2 isoform X1 n=1 Tax=Xyrichtys novacula TaxID=13765 RepID=A0AAV1EUS4_XYRNO|nr:anti-sigma-I factor RsgI2 isoform X1 [Xyrichtys novacula]